MLSSDIINKCRSSNDGYNKLPRQYTNNMITPRRNRLAQTFAILVTVTVLTFLIWTPLGRPSRSNVDSSATKEKTNPPWMSAKAPPGKYKIYMYRILGNDLPPRHKPGQVLKNVRFILENEPNFPHSMKWWILNRIVNSEYENALIDLMVEYNQYYFRIPFDDEEYQKIDFRLEDFPEPDFLHSHEYMNFSKVAKLRTIDYTYYDKNLYAMNNNGGRNAALLHAKSQSSVPRWIFPFDGNCYLTKRAFDEITMQIEKWGDQYSYFVVPMARLLNNTQVLVETGARPPTPDEPQVIFRHDAKEKYNEKMRYGRRSKLELLWRLGVPKPFRRAFNIPWETQSSSDIVDPKVKYKLAGYVYRLFSGKANQEFHRRESSTLRAYNRLLAIQDLLDGIDERIARKSKEFNPNRLSLYNEETLNSAQLKYWSGNVKISNIVNKMLESANEISSTVASWYNNTKHLHAGVDTQVELLELKNSDNSKEENDHSLDREQVFLSDNQVQLEEIIQNKNVPETEGVDKTFDIKSEKNVLPQISTSSLFENITILTLAHHFSGDVGYSRWAANLIRTFLLSSYGIREKVEDSKVSSKDNNHLDTINDEGYGFPYLNKIPRVIPKFRSTIFQHPKDLFDTDPSSFLDACRLLYRVKAITHKEYMEIRLFASYWLETLINSPEGIEISLSSDHRGVLYDLQVASLASFLDDVRLYLRVTNRARMRIPKHFYIDNDAPVTSPTMQINEIIYVKNEIRQGRTPSDKFDENVFKHSTLNLQYWMLLTRINQNVGIGPDLWKYVSREGKQLSQAIIGHFNEYSKNFENISSLLPLLYFARAAYRYDEKKLGIIYNCEEYKKTNDPSEDLQKFLKSLSERTDNSEKIKLRLLCGDDLIGSNDMKYLSADSRTIGVPPLWMLGIA